MDLCEKLFVVLGFTALAVCGLVLIGAVHTEITNPCVELGEQYVSHFRKIGDITLPVYSSDCLKRTHE